MNSQRSAELFFQQLTEKIPIMIYVYKKGKFVYANSAFTDCLGYSREELFEMNIWEVIHPDSQHMNEYWRIKRMRGETEPERFELKAVTKTGQFIWGDVCFSSIELDGEIFGIVGVYDISEQKLIREQLELSETRYRAVVEDQTELIGRSLPDTSIIFVNDAYCRFSGRTYQQLVGNSFLPLIIGEDHENIRQKLNQLRPKNPFFVYEERVPARHGRDRWVEWKVRGIFDKDSHLIEFQYVGRNITARKYAEYELQKARDELEMRVKERTLELSKANEDLTALYNNLNNIVKNMSDAVVLIDEMGQVEILNQVLMQFGEELLSEVKSQLQLDILEAKNTNLSRMLKRKQAFRDEEIIFTTKKGDIHCLASGTPIKNEKGVNSIVLIIRPIKEIHKLVNRFSGAQASFHFEDIVTNNRAMLNTIQTARTAATSLSNVLIEGESGTGKEMFAQAIHNHGYRKNGPFVAVNCGAIPRELIGSELFGYVEGAFTGAKKEGKPGKFELASEGTLFLDEIGDMPFDQQVALLRVIQEKQITRIGGNKVIPINTRIICATNKNLLEEMQKGNFREDLYYRLNVISIQIPPLRERPDDIPLLFQHFLMQLDPDAEKKLEYMDKQILEYLMQYTWPGNVRQLQNIIERVLHNAAGSNLCINHIPIEIFSQSNAIINNHYKPTGQNAFRSDTQKRIDELERQEIIALLEKNHGNVSQAARELMISRSTMYRKIRYLGIKY